MSQVGSVFISGVVRDDMGETLPGANVVVLDANGEIIPNLGTATDINGKYSLTVPILNSYKSLRASFVGFSPKVKTLTEARDNPNFVLGESSQKLDEVVITPDEQPKKKNNNKKLLIIAGVIVLSLGLGYGAYRYFKK